MHRERAEDLKSNSSWAGSVLYSKVSCAGSAYETQNIPENNNIRRRTSRMRKCGRCSVQRAPRGISISSAAISGRSTPDPPGTAAGMERPPSVPSSAQLRKIIPIQHSLQHTVQLSRSRRRRQRASSKHMDTRPPWTSPRTAPRRRRRHYRHI